MVTKCILGLLYFQNNHFGVNTKKKNSNKKMKYQKIVLAIVYSKIKYLKWHKSMWLPKDK